MVVALLRIEGFAPVTAPNGAEALALLRASVPAQVILLDAMMPVMDGWTFRRLQRADATLASIPWSSRRPSTTGEKATTCERPRSLRNPSTSERAVNGAFDVHLSSDNCNSKRVVFGTKPSRRTARARRR